MMTAKDYELIAAALHEAMERVNEMSEGAIALASSILARELAKDNPRFNAAMFYAAVRGE